MKQNLEVLYKKTYAGHCIRFYHIADGDILKYT
jgi:hypothetical protein